MGHLEAIYTFTKLDVIVRIKVQNDSRLPKFMFPFTAICQKTVSDMHKECKNITLPTYADKKMWTIVNWR